MFERHEVSIFSKRDVSVLIKRLCVYWSIFFLFKKLYVFRFKNDTLFANFSQLYISKFIK